MEYIRIFYGYSDFVDARSPEDEVGSQKHRPSEPCCHFPFEGPIAAMALSMHTLSAKGTFVGKTAELASSPVGSAKALRVPVVVRAQQQDAVSRSRRPCSRTSYGFTGGYDVHARIAGCQQTCCSGTASWSCCPHHQDWPI